MTAIFDLDGTLVDSSQVLGNAINHVRNYLDLPPLPISEIIEQINNPECHYANYFYNIEQVEPIHEDIFKEYYSANHNKELELFHGIPEMLKELKQNGIKLAIATNAYREPTIEVLENLNLIKYFDTIATFDDVREGKPSPKMLYKVIDDLQSKKPIFIGDSQRDLLASQNANIEFILVDFVNKKSSIEELSNSIKEYLIET